MTKFRSWVIDICGTLIRTLIRMHVLNCQRNGFLETVYQNSKLSAKMAIQLQFQSISKRKQTSHTYSENRTESLKLNLVPRVSLLPAKSIFDAFEGKKRDPGNEVVLSWLWLLCKLAQIGINIQYLISNLHFLFDGKWHMNFNIFLAISTAIGYFVFRTTLIPVPETKIEILYYWNKKA